MHNDHTVPENGTYRTGSTVPPKSRRGLIATLLILVILLATSVTVMGLMNIHLFRLLEKQNQQSVQFSFTEPQNVMAISIEEQPSVEIPIPDLGITGQEITMLYRSYQEWPQGIYISYVDDDGVAQAAGICPGDILIAVNGVPVDSMQSLEEKLSGIASGSPCMITVFRDQQELALSVMMPGK